MGEFGRGKGRDPFKPGGRLFLCVTTFERRQWRALSAGWGLSSLPPLVRGPHHLHPQVPGLLDLPQLLCTTLSTPGPSSNSSFSGTPNLAPWSPQSISFPWVVWGGSSPACPWPSRGGAGGERERGFGPSPTASLSVREAPLGGDGHVEPPPHRSLGNVGGPQTALLHWPQHSGTSP